MAGISAGGLVRLALAGLIFLLPACREGTGPELLPPYDGPTTTGQEEWTGYQPGSVDVYDLVGGGGSFGGPVYGGHSYAIRPRARDRLGHC